ncbi:MAG TPA: low temperature requirement protein A [Polyangiaceae bacterium]|nr:low temperature requirement protein A [Polyangiaceae bacterium]
MAATSAVAGAARNDGGGIRNRWLERPSLRRAATARRFTWLELLYDVVTGTALVALGDALSRNSTADRFVTFSVTTAAIWIAWTGFTFFHNRFAADDLLHRVLVLLQIFALGAFGVTAPRVLDGDTRTFSVGYGVSQLVLAVFYSRARSAIGEARSLSTYYAGLYTLSAVVWFSSAATPTRVTLVLWAVGVLIGLSFPVNRRSRQLATEHPPDVRHASERYGLLTLVLLGLGYASVLRVLSGHDDGHALAVATLSLLVAFSLFWLYFDDVAGASIKSEPGAAFVWVYSHLPLSIGLVATLAGIAGIAGAPPDGRVAEPVRWLAAGGLSLSLLGMALIDSVTVRRHVEVGDRTRVSARMVFAVIALATAPIGASLNPVELLALTAAPCVAMVVFDLMMAPLATLLSTESESSPIVASFPPLSGDAPRGRPNRVGEAIRKGTPSELRRDLYFLFMEGPWSRLVLSLAFLYLAANSVFAGLYLLEPGSIANAKPSSFADAFFFSVQTFATIGYGGMTPATPYGNVLVTTEAAVSLIATAVATGLMVAKASRPRSSTVFSDVMVLGPRNGVPALMFRAGNARGNEVVDASVTVTALMDDVSLEGHRMRRMHDMTLLRSRSPMFTMTWSVIHEIDEKSPLHGLDLGKPGPLVAIIVTLMGHDGTYGQTTYSRKVYLPTDIRPGHRFVDVTSQLEDGRFVIDYGKFHDTVPQDAPGARSDPPSQG